MENSRQGMFKSSQGLAFIEHLKRNYSNTKELACEWCFCIMSAYAALHFSQDYKHKLREKAGAFPHIF